MITTARGLEKSLAQEVRALGMPVTWAGISGVKTEGGLAEAMKLCLHLRTGHRVLYLLRQCSCRNADELYREAGEIAWETIVPADGYVSVTANVVNETIKDTRFAGVRCKDAIVDRILRRKGRRPDSGPEQKGAVVNLFWRRERCEIFLDVSGEPLSRRGYRKIPLGAPLQETLAAGIIAATGWDGKSPFVNPMCGSGTLAIEAALIAALRPPGLLRPSFGFMKTLLFDTTLWARLRAEARAVQRPSAVRIIATDISTVAVEAARANARTAGVENRIEFKTGDFAETEIPEGGGVVVMNPEYGMRMGQKAGLEADYRRIGDFLKRKCQGYTGWVLTGSTALAGRIGLKSKRKFTFWNGTLECRLYEYDLYR